MTDINLLLVDDHQVVRTGLRMLLEGQPDMKIVGEADSGLQALEKAKELSQLGQDLVVVQLENVSDAALAGKKAIRSS